MLILARLPNRRPLIVYDPSFSADAFGVQVDPAAGRADEAREIMTAAGAVEIRAGR